MSNPQNVFHQKVMKGKAKKKTERKVERWREEGTRAGEGGKNKGKFSR